MKDLFINLRIEVLVCAYIELGMEWNFSNVNDPFARIYYITDGDGTVEHHGKLFKLKKDHIYLIPEYSRARLFCSSFLHQWYTHFKAEIFPDISLFQLIPPLYHVDISKEVALQQLIISYSNENRNTDMAESIAIDGLLRILISKFYTANPLISNEGISGISKFTKVFEYMDKRLSERIMLKDLASVLHLQPTYFSNLFCKTFGIPPMQYLNRKRIEKAMFLLRTNDESVESIAYKLGFEDMFYFSRIFKKITGFSPREYKKKSITVV